MADRKPLHTPFNHHLIIDFTGYHPSESIKVQEKLNLFLPEISPKTTILIDTREPDGSDNWDEEHTVEMWQKEVFEGNTHLGYLDWVDEQTD